MVVLDHVAYSQVLDGDHGVLIDVLAGRLVRVVLALLAVTLGTINVVGGFVVTDRMLEMFRKRPGGKS